MKIFINPGHGGDDCGAVGHGLREVDVAFNIGTRVTDYLRNVGYVVKLFQFDGLQTICNTANDWHADLFVSIHCNAGGGTGTETFCYYGSAKGETLAAFIQNQILKSLPVVNRGVKHNDFQVLRDTLMPAALVETAFIDNANDARLLRDRQDDFARAIARDISDYYARPAPDVVDVPSRR